MMSSKLDNYPLSAEYVILKLSNSIESYLSYSNLIQSILILYAFLRGVGRKGNFWKILYIGALSSFIERAITSICEIILEKQDANNQSISLYYLLLFNETFYAIRNLVLPYINVVKVMPLLETRERKKLRIFVGTMTVIHFLLCYNIGYYRLSNKVIKMADKNFIRKSGYATISVSLTDIVCSMIIIKKLIVNYHIAARKNLNISIYKFFFQSALFTLIFIDFVSLIVGILAVVGSPILDIIIVPFTGLFSNVILFLAFDALIFKNDIIMDMESSYDYSSFSDNTNSDEMLQYNNNDPNNVRCRNRYNNSNNNSQTYYPSNYFTESYCNSQFNNQYDSQDDSQNDNQSTYQNNNQTNNQYSTQNDNQSNKKFIYQDNSLSIYNDQNNNNQYNIQSGNQLNNNQYNNQCNNPQTNNQYNQHFNYQYQNSDGSQCSSQSFSQYNNRNSGQNNEFNNKNNISENQTTNRNSIPFSENIVDDHNYVSQKG